MLCILEISLIRPAEMSHPLKALQSCFEIDWLPDRATANRFLAGLLYRTEDWLNEVRLEKHQERAARGRATLPPGETTLTLVAVEQMCRHHGLARVQGDDFATFFLEWFITDERPATFEQGQWLHPYREHQARCEQDFLPLPVEPDPSPVSSSWPFPPPSGQAFSSSS